MPGAKEMPNRETESGRPTAAVCRRHPCPACHEEAKAAYRALWNKSRDWEAYTGLMVGALIAAAIFLPLLLWENEKINWGWYFLTPPLTAAAVVAFIFGSRHSDRLEKAAKALRQAAAAPRPEEAA